MSSDHLDNESFTDFEKSCPLCMELFDLDDMGFLPCPCGYRICRFCWHRLKTYEDNIEAGFEDQDGSASSGRCPACRQVYSDVPAGFDSNLTAMLDSNKYKKKKKRLQNKQKQKLQEEKQKLKEILKRDEKSLAGLRVVQKNLVFVIGIQQRSHEELRREFSKLGKIHKLVIGNTNNTNLNTAYVTYTRPEDAIKAIQALNQGCLNSQLILNSQSKLMSKSSTGANRPAQGILKASLGTTKYCNHWLKNLQCPKLPDCMYLHELADQEASFTKEDMQKNKHAEYEKKLIQEYLDKNKTNCDTLLTDNNNLKNSNSENSNSSSSIDNLGLSHTAENQLNHQMNLNEEDSRTRLPAAYEPFEFNSEDSSSVFSSSGRTFGQIASGHTYNAAFSLSRLPESSASDQPLDEQQRSSKLPKENCDKENGAAAAVASSSSSSSSSSNQQNGGSLMMLGQLHPQNGQQQSDEASGDTLLTGSSKSKLSSSNNICINSSSYIDAQQLLTIDDSHNSITDSNNLNGNGNSSTNGALLLFSSSNAKSKCINIDNSRGSSKMRMNLLDEIIANSSDSSTTSYSTCSSGSNRLNQTDLNEFNNNLILNGEHLNSLNLMDTNGKFGVQHSPNNHNHLTVGSLEDDGLDFDPISVSTIGLQDLLKTSSSSTAGMHSTNAGNLLNQNSTANTLNHLLFGHSLVHQPASPPQQQQQQYNQLNQLNPMNHPLSHLAQPSNLSNLNGVLHNTAPQPTKPSPLSQLAVNSERSNLFAGNLFSGGNSIASLGSLGSLNSASALQQSGSTNGASTPVDPNDTWRNSLRALLPNVNITFSNSSSSSSANQNSLNPNSLSNPQSQLLFKQQIAQQSLAGAGQLNQQQLNSQAPIKPPNAMSSFPVARQPQQQQQQQPNTIKSSQQGFLNQLQQSQQLQHNQLQQQQQQNHHQQMQQQAQPQNIYPLAFLHQQLLRQQQQAAAGLNLQFANANAGFFNEQQQMKANQMQASPSQASPQAPPIAPLHLNNLQRFFSQQPHQQPPPGF